MARLRKNKEHRAAYVSSQINIGIPFQIRALRKQRKWDQKNLALEAGMLQPRISAMESPGYGSLNLDTLQRLAAAFDVALIVRFAPFGELIRWSDGFSPDDFVIPSFGDEVELPGSNENRVAFSYLDTATVTASSLLPTDTDTYSAGQQIPGRQASVARVTQTACIRE